MSFPSAVNQSELAGNLLQEAKPLVECSKLRTKLVPTKPSCAGNELHAHARIKANRRERRTAR